MKRKMPWPKRSHYTDSQVLLWCWLNGLLP